MLNKQEERAGDRVNYLKKYTVNYFKPEFSFWNDTDFLVFYLTENDISKKGIIMNLEYNECLEWYYALRVKKLNVALENIEQAESYK